MLQMYQHVCNSHLYSRIILVKLQVRAPSDLVKKSDHSATYILQTLHTHTSYIIIHHTTYNISLHTSYILHTATTTVLLLVPG